VAGTNEIQVGRLNGLLHKLLAMKEGSPSPTLAPEIVPAIILENDRPEFHFAAGTTIAMAGGDAGAVVGQVPQILITNPASSGVLTILEHVLLIKTAATVFAQLLPTSVGSGGQARNVRDSRRPPVVVAGSHAGIATRVTGTNAAVSLITAAGYVMRAEVDTFQTDLEIVLGPGTEILFEGSVGGIGLTMAFRWRERAIEPSEQR